MRSGKGELKQRLTHGVETAAKIILGTLLFGLIFCALLNIPFGFEPEMLDAFDVDEGLGFSIAAKALAAREPFSCQGIYEHGSVPQALNYYLIRALSTVGYSFNGRLLTLTLRYLSFVPYVFLLFLIFKLASWLNKRSLPALVTVVCLAAVPDLYHYALIIHPDLLQTALLVLAASLALMFQPALPALLLSGAILGLAMAAKLNAIYLVPFLPLPYLLHLWRRRKDGIGRFIAVGAALIVVYSAVTLIAFFAVNPEAFINFGEYTRRMREIAATIRQAWAGQTTRDNPLLWFNTIAADLGWLWLSAILVGFAWSVIESVRGLSRASGAVSGTERVRNESVLLLAAYVIFAMVLLMIQVKMRDFRYVYHLLPFLVLLGIGGLFQLALRLKGDSNAVVATVGLMLAVGLAPAAVRTIEANAWMTRRYDSDVVTYAGWIAERYNKKAPVALDRYVYVDRRMLPRSETVFGEEALLPASRRFKLFVLSREGIGRYAWKLPGTRWSDGEIKARGDYPETRHEYIFVKELALQGQSGIWKLVYGGEDALIVENREFRVKDGDRRN